MTDSSGAFVFANVGAGQHRLIFRRLGFRPAAVDVDVGAEGFDGIEVLMVPWRRHSLRGHGSGSS